MSKNGPIIIIEDDKDDKELFELAVRDSGIKIPIEWFFEAESAFQHLLWDESSIYLIFCDINLPRKNGLAFKRDIDQNPKLREKSIPFIFYSTAAKPQDIEEAYTELVHKGFFKKENWYTKMKETLKTIFDYRFIWKHSNSAD